MTRPGPRHARDLDRGERWARCAVWAAAWFVFGVFVCDAVWVVLG